MREQKKKVKMSSNKIIIALWLVKIYGATDRSERVTSGLLLPEFMNPKKSKQVYKGMISYMVK